MNTFKSSQEVETEITKQNEELDKVESRQEVLELDDIDLAKQIIKLQVSRKELAPNMIRNKHTIRRLRQDLKSLDVLKWSWIRKESGR